MVRKALGWLGRADSPLRIEPRLELDLIVWLLRFVRNSSRARYRAGLRAMLTLALRSVEAFDCLRQQGVDFELYEDGLVFAALSKSELSRYVELFEVLEHEGYKGNHYVVSRQELGDFEPVLGPGVAGAVYAPAERHLRPEGFMAALVDFLAERAKIIEFTEVHTVHADAGRVEAISFGDSVLEVDGIVLAAGLWTRELLDVLGAPLPLIAAKGYSVTLENPSSVPRRPLYLVEAQAGVSPFDCCIRIAGILDLVHDETFDARRVAALRRAVRVFFADPALAEGRGEEWVGLRPFLPDGLPAIGRLAGFANVYVATGHGMLGITLAPGTGETLAPLILANETDRNLRPFDPGRFVRRPARALIGRRDYSVFMKTEGDERDGHQQA